MDGRTSITGKVFGIGLARTGTTSLHEAMGILGFRSAPDSIPLLDGLDRVFLDRYDAFFDNPVPFRYRELDVECPGSRYVVTYRRLDRWLPSMEWLFGPGLDRLSPTMRAVGDRVHQDVYGTTTFDAARLTDIHTRHYDEIGDWVRDRSHFWVDVDEGLSWAPLCELLDVPVPRQPFPMANRRRARFKAAVVDRWSAREH